MRRCPLYIVFVLAVSGCGGCSQAVPEEVPEKPKPRDLKQWTTDLQSGETWEKRWAAAVTLGEMGAEALPVLAELEAALSDPSWEVRKQVVWTLVHVDREGTKVVHTICGALKDEEVDVRAKAAEALAKLKAVAEPAIPDLIPLLKSPAQTARLHAVLALGDIIDSLLKRAERDDVRQDGLMALGVTGPLAAEALEQLHFMRDLDVNYSVRYAANEAVTQIEKHLPKRDEKNPEKQPDKNSL